MGKRLTVNAGEKYGRLTVISEVAPQVWSGRKCRKFLCSCDCGEKKEVLMKDFRSGAVKSCGCLHDTLPIKHGQARDGENSITYKSWSAMRKRCLNPNAADYHCYGGRGIQICERWNDFAAFLEDMGDRPSQRHTIDRIDAEGDYTPDNCRWATPKQQGRNRNNNRMLTFNGETLCLSEWAERAGMSIQALRSRLDVCGYTVEEALTLPIGVRRKND